MWGERYRDPAGNVIFDTSWRIGRIFGSVHVTDNGSMNVPQFAEGTPFYVCLGETGNDYNPPNVSVSGTTLQWSYAAFPPPSGTTKSPATILFGAY